MIFSNRLAFRAVRSWLWRSLASAALFLSLPACRTSAQTAETREEQGSVCISKNLARLIVPEGRAVRVLAPGDQADAESRHRFDARALPATESPSDARALAEARRYFEQDARKGYPQAQVNLGIAALAGWGGKPNAGTALYWLSRAAEQHYAVAYYNLGVLYWGGCGVRRDEQQAFQYFAEGAKSGDIASEVNLGYFYSHGIGTAKDLGAAAYWYRHAADSGDPQGQFNLAGLYLDGQGVPANDASAFYWFRKAAIQGHALAQLMLGSMHRAGRGTPIDLQEAYAWLKTAELQGELRARPFLAVLEGQLSGPQIEAGLLRAETLAKPAAAIAAAR